MLRKYLLSRWCLDGEEVGVRWSVGAKGEGDVGMDGGGWIDVGIWMGG